MWEPGATFGTALASLVFGDSDPSGKLPITFPASPNQGPATPAEYPGLTDPGSVRRTTSTSSSRELHEASTWATATTTHHETPLFPFGYGLSYTSFDAHRQHPGRDGTVTVVIKDTNRGSVAGPT